MPRYGSIIEPFAGAANYACRYYDRDVWINDLDENVVSIWRWIREASPSDVRALPELKKGDRISDIKGLCEGERMLLQKSANRGSAGYQDQVTAWSAGSRKKPRPGDKQRRDASEFQRLRIRLLRIAGKIKHWKITNLDYQKMLNRDATWFIDPPYQHLGKSYKHNNKGIDFERLSDWSLSRQGQIIVCEAFPADWLPFTPLQHRKIQSNSAKKGYQEMIYHRSEMKVGLERLV